MTSVRASNTYRDTFPDVEVVVRRNTPSTNHPNGTHLTDSALRPQLVKSVSGLYPRDSNEDLLLKIDSIWREDKLFTRSSSPEDNFYYEYLSDLQQIVETNKSEFSSLLEPVKKKRPFVREFTELCNNTYLNAFQRAFCATQALELALLGANPTGVLRSINKANGWDGTKGFRNELLAGWFLAKFIYQLSPSKQFKFVHSELLHTIHGYSNPKKKEKVANKVEIVTNQEIKDTNDKEKVTKLPQPLDREVDITTADSLVSVKTSGNHYAEQICNLFFMVADNRGINGSNLKNKINKLILIKTAEKPEQLLPNYKDRPEYWELKDKIIADVRRKVEELYPLESQEVSFKDCYNRLISKHGIDLYYLPPVESIVEEKDCVRELRDWIDENYRALDKITNMSRIA